MTKPIPEGLKSPNDSPSQNEKLDKLLERRMRRAINIAREVCKMERLPEEASSLIPLATEFFHKID
jgi:hypothetical protein